MQGCMGWTLQGGINGSTSRATAPHPWVQHRASREGVERGRSPKVGVKQQGRPRAHSSRAAVAPASAGREAVLTYAPEQPFSSSGMGTLDRSQHGNRI